MRTFLLSAAKSLLLTVATTVVVAVIKGEPLAGLTRLKGLYNIFVKTSVPAWLFTAVLFVALLGIQSGIAHLSRMKLHFVPDSDCYWAQAARLSAAGGALQPQMQVGVSGTFTFEGKETVSLLKANFKNTTCVSISFQVSSLDKAIDRAMVEAFDLSPGDSMHAYIVLRLEPSVGTLGRPYRGRLIFLDQKNRQHRLQPVAFPHRG